MDCTNDIEIVYVSPMRRTLQTSYHIFKNKDNFNQIKFIVLPDLRENFFSACDIPNDVDLVKAEYSQLFGENLDFSRVYELMDKSESEIIKKHKIWFLCNLQKKDSDKLLAIIAGEKVENYS